MFQDVKYDYTVHLHRYRRLRSPRRDMQRRNLSCAHEVAFRGNEIAYRYYGNEIASRISRCYHLVVTRCYLVPTLCYLVRTR